MLVKPIGLLWLWVLLWKRHVKVALIGAILFAAYTLLFLFNGSGSYYTTNLLNHFLYPSTVGPNQIITLRAFLLYSTSWPDLVLKTIQYSALGIVLFFSSLKRVHLAKGIFLAVVYYLFFYDFVFKYQYTSLAPAIAICLICCPEFQTRLSRCFIVLTCLPSTFVLLNFWHINVTPDNFYGPNPATLGWQWMVISKVGPVLLLVISVLARDVVPAYKQSREFLQAIGKTNREMEVFG